MKQLLVLVCLLIAACADEVAYERPQPIEMSDSALGHYCQMDIVNHEGPKGQIHLSGHTMPIWFSQVRDGLAYIKSAERAADITAFYVSDMGRAQHWSSPGIDNWVDAETAFFVVGSDAIGGMGAPELVPFSKFEDATKFKKNRGGEIIKMADIKPDDVLSPIEIGQFPGGHK